MREVKQVLLKKFGCATHAFAGRALRASRVRTVARTLVAFVGRSHAFLHVRWQQRSRRARGSRRHRPVSGARRVRVVNDTSTS